MTTRSARRAAVRAAARQLLGSTAILTALGAPLMAAAPVLAQQTSIQQAPIQQAQARNFNIPAQPLAGALRQFSDQSGLQLAYATAELQGLSSSAVRGSLPPEEALQQLLSGTSVTYRFTAANTVTLSRLDSTTLPPVIVEASLANPNAQIGNLLPAYEGGQVARGSQVGLLGNRDVMDTPFNQTGYMSKLIQDQQARSIADVVANDPSVRVNFPRGSFSDTYMIRGFTNNSDIMLDGHYGLMSSFLVMAETAERVEVLKGPNALLNGMSLSGSVGGAINIVPKRAEDEPITRLTTSYSSDSQYGNHIDVGRRFGANQEVGVRFNGVYRNGETSVENNEQELGLGALALDYRGERARLSVDLGHQTQNTNSGLRGILVAPGIAVPDAPDASKNYTQPWSFIDINDTYGLVQGEYDLTDSITAFAAFGARHATSDALFSTPRITIPGGGFTDTPFFFPSYTDVTTGEAGVRAKAATGDIKHDVVVSASALHREDSSAFTFFAGTPSNIYNPILAPRPNTSGLPGSSDLPKTAESDLSSLAVADTLSMMDNRLQVTLGLRQQMVSAKGFNGTTGAQTTSYNEDRLSPATGIVVKPWSNLSLYANYIEGLTQGPTATPGTTNAGEIFPPMVTKQYEAGAKMDWSGFTTTLAFFQITQPSGITDPATLHFGIDSEQRNRGIELNTFGEITPSARLLGGVMLLNGELTKTAGGTNDGHDAIGAPNVQINLGGEWDVPFLHGLTLTGRMIYTGKQYLDAANTQSIPDWTRFDVGARYAFETGGTPIVIRASIENLFDENYWASTGGGLLSLAAPRTYLLSTSFDF